MSRRGVRSSVYSHNGVVECCRVIAVSSSRFKIICRTQRYCELYVLGVGPPFIWRGSVRDLLVCYGRCWLPCGQRGTKPWMGMTILFIGTCEEHWAGKRLTLIFICIYFVMWIGPWLTWVQCGAGFIYSRSGLQSTLVSLGSKVFLYDHVQ